MRNRVKVVILIMLFWITFQTVLLLNEFPSFPVLIFTIMGIIIFHLIGMLLDFNNTKVHKWFGSTKFFKKKNSRKTNSRKTNSRKTNSRKTKK